ncbi:unnamed protein product [Eruca vesicaria subsp. sativa]|uniref:DDT domain-containing protein n=1 Tax=Eruca vesicaria subsp. sativa TaxID=29727 RepID=A0ABC8M473_ERUVS|nr:unnamed protein product [Eruca vesicaria subsp. sativa]
MASSSIPVANHHSPSSDDASPAPETKNPSEDPTSLRRTRPSRACTVRAQQRLQEQQAAERKVRPLKKEFKREVEEEEDDDDEDEEEEEEDENPRQCVGGGGSLGKSKIVTSLVQPPEASQMPRWNLRSMWELASVLNFLHVFRPLLKINAEFSAEEFETALLNPNDTLSDIHIPLLKAIPPATRTALTRDTWVTVLCRKIRDCWHWFAEGDLPIIASQGREIEVYKSLDPAIRVVILKALCDIRVEQDDIRSYIDNSLKTGVHLSAFRKDRVGGDSHGVNFWYEDDPLVGHRLYREIRKVEVAKVKTKGSKILPNVTYQWETVATNFDEFQDVSEKLNSSSSRIEVSLGKKLTRDMLPEIEKEHKRKEKLLKKQHRQALLLDNYLVVDGLGAGRSLRDRKRVRYTFDDYDRSINEAIKITKKKHPSLEEPFLHRRESARLDALANGTSTSSTHPTEPVNDTASAGSSDFADSDEFDEQRDESMDRSNRRRQRPQRYSATDFVETVSDNDAEIESDDDIVGEAVYDEEYLKKRKQKKLSSGSEGEEENGDEEYKWDEDNAEYEEEEEEEDEDSLSGSEEDSDEPRRGKKMPRREAKSRSRSRSNNFQPGLRRSKRATRIDYQQYELSESDKEAPGAAKRKRLVEPDEHSDESGNGNFTMGSEGSEENANDPETESAEEEEEPREVNDNAEKTNGTENNIQLNKSNGTDQEEVEGVVGKRHYLDLNELAPVSGFDDGPSTALKDDDKTDNL